MNLLHITIGALLQHNADQLPDREAAVFTDAKTRYTWQSLNEEVNRTAKGLAALGIGHGDHVAIWGTNVPVWLLTQLAVARLGGVLVTINPEWKQQELQYALTQSDTRVLVMIPGWEKTIKNKVIRYDYLSMIREICPALPCADAFPELSRIVVAGDAPDAPGFLTWEDCLRGGAAVADAELEAVAGKVAPHDIALLQYTSGTTGFPKGAMLTHYNVMNNAWAAAEHMGVHADDRICGPVPFYHCFGSILFVLGALVSGAALVVPAPMFHPHKTLEAVQSERCTALYGVPTMFIAEMEEIDFDAFDLRSLRTGIMAGAPVDKELYEAVTKRMGAREMTIAYGLTEASPVTHQTMIVDPVEKRITTVGRPVDHTESRIVNPGTFKTLSVGEVGEIWVKGWHVMKGYYKKPEETAKAIVEDGWLRTGDLGVMDENGYYRIVGRLKEMFIVGGHNVYPAEVEQSLHTLLEDKVDMLQVVGVPHPKLQEVAALVVKLIPGKYLTLEEVQQRCDGKLEWPKIPRHLKILDDFSVAMTVTGKIQKFKLTDMLRQEWGL
ncbi:MAG: AMP-binding protein [Saprospiraceae bacterium]|nr:AMP-binding protein [Saprospiraceae bacterium]